MMQTEKIRVSPYSFPRLIQDIETGKLRIPRFQREFVWERSRIQKLLDSMCKEYPIGTLFFWEAPSEYNHLLRNVEDLKQPAWRKNESYTFILDGQQRLTSLYATIKGLVIDGENYGKIVVDLGNADPAKLSFQYRNPDNKRWIAVKDLLDNSDNFLEIYDALTNDYRREFQNYRNLLLKYPFSVVIVNDMDMENAIEIFERINQQGKRLSRYDLISASVLTEEFDLRTRTKVDIAEKLQSFGTISDSTIPQALALNIKNRTETTTQLSLKSDDVKTNWQRTVDCFNVAVDFVQHNLGVARADFLPYDAILPVLAYYFFYADTNSLTSSKHREQLERWFWRVAFSERYSGASQTRMTEDAAWIRSLVDEGQDFEHPVNIDLNTLVEGSMQNSTSAIRNGILCLLSLRRPFHFKNGSEIKISGDHFSKFTLAERHHIFPISFLKSQGITNTRQVHRIPNFCFIPAELNKEISDRPPSEYMREIKDLYDNIYDFERIMKSHLIPVSEDSGIWTDDYELFLSQRAKLLLEEIKHLCGITIQVEQEVRNPVIDEIEKAIRDTIHHALSAAYGADYWKDGVSSVAGDVNKTVMDRVDKYVRETPDVSKKTFENLRERLNFFDVSDYSKIITRKKNWSLFSPIFRDRNDCERYLDDFREFRNATKHNRDIDTVLDHRGQAAILWLSRSMDVDLSQYGIL